jgi:Mrp family chromosome partitioning ATPase
MSLNCDTCHFGEPDPGVNESQYKGGISGAQEMRVLHIFGVAVGIGGAHLQHVLYLLAAVGLNDGFTHLRRRGIGERVFAYNALMLEPAKKYLDGRVVVSDSNRRVHQLALLQVDADMVQGNVARGADIHQFQVFNKRRQLLAVVVNALGRKVVYLFCQREKVETALDGIRFKTVQVLEVEAG